MSNRQPDPTFPDLTPSPVFHHVQVVVAKSQSGSGYDVATYPHKITVTRRNAVIAYQLVHPTPADIRLTGFTEAPLPPDVPRQLSAPAISPDHRVLTLIDLNTKAITMDIHLQFIDGDKVPFEHDPQIGNDPES